MGSALPLVQELLHGRAIAGSPAEARAGAHFADVIGIDAAQFSRTVFAAQAELAPLTGVAVRRLAEQLERGAATGGLAVQESAARGRSALGDYAREVDAIHREAVRLTGHVTDALGRIDGAMRDVTEICAAIGVTPDFTWNNPPPPALPEPHAADGIRHTIDEAYRARWQATVLGWQGEVTQIEQAAARWRGLIEERQQAEAALVRRLEDTPVGQLLTLGDGMPGGSRTSIAVGLTGEIGGVRHAGGVFRSSHPLLAGLLGTADGADIWDAPPHADTVAEWWAGLTAAERTELTASVPWVIGNLSGLLPSVRDRANRELVAFYRLNPQLLSADGLALIAEMQRAIDRAGAQAHANPPVQILACDLTGDVPRAAVGYGDLDSASHTTVQVPGMNSDAHDGLSQWDTAARALVAAQSQLLLRRSGASPGVIAWLGYDTPGVPPSAEVLASGAALAGADRLRAELDGIAGARRHSPAGPTSIGVVAHSYGTLVAAIALRDVAEPVTTFVMLGSAGLDPREISSLGQLRVLEESPGQPAIFATNASRDRLAPTGAALSGRSLPTTAGRLLLGAAGLAPGYAGAIEFPSDGDPARALEATDGHSHTGAGAKPGFGGISASAGHGYGDAKTQALDTTARATTQTIDVATRATQSITGRDAAAS